MQFTIQYIKNDDFLEPMSFTGTVEEASRFAAEALRQNHADLAAIMDGADLDSAPKALITAPA